MKIPSLKQAKELLEEAGKLNPGPWIKHSISVAEAARNIAEHHKELDSEKSYIFGCLHDIGRRTGFSHLKHTIDGYRFMNELGYPDVARICLTHPFPIKEIDSYAGENDCSSEDVLFISKYLSEIQYSEYDRLLQLCDALGGDNGFWMLEKRMIDVILRHKKITFLVEKLEKTFEIKNNIEKSIGKSIYDLLPGVVENTFKR